MKLIADFHIHSKFSMATSKDLNPENLDLWSKIKGINIIGTGDFTHPEWLKELKEKLSPAEKGLFVLKKEFEKQYPFSCNNSYESPRFILTAEISCIYKRHGKVRKVHNIVFAPDFETVERIQQWMIEKKFNIKSDGRPIIGFDSKDLLDELLNINPDILFVPAHIWTPWFSLFGDKSGFNSIEECFGDSAKYIYAAEMGLSSNPPMNWAISNIDNLTLLANSDSHSPEKIGRNANILNCNLNYSAIISAIKSGNTAEFIGTINFFPQEGKYHFDGHRKCNVCYTPLDTIVNKGRCSVCGKPVVVGVLNRIAQMADRDDILLRPVKPLFFSLIPLKEIISQITGKGESSKEVVKQYYNAIECLKSEFDVLLNSTLDEIATAGGKELASAIEKMRAGEVSISEGYDGEYGKISIIENAAKINPLKLSFDLKEFRRLKQLYYSEPIQGELF